MSIRVHKAVGYGIRPFMAPEDFHTKIEEAYDLTLKDFTAWCHEKQECILNFVPDTDRIRRMMFVECDLRPLNRRHFKELLGSRILYDAEFGIKDALLLLPLTHDGWRRYDSTIDWVEETQFHDQKPRFEKVSVELSPYTLGKPHSL
jgi:hypothetical protein